MAFETLYGVRSFQVICRNNLYVRDKHLCGQNGLPTFSVDLHVYELMTTHCIAAEIGYFMETFKIISSTNNTLSLNLVHSKIKILIWILRFNHLLDGSSTSETPGGDNSARHFPFASLQQKRECLTIAQIFSLLVGRHFVTYYAKRMFCWLSTTLDQAQSSASIRKVHLTGQNFGARGRYSTTSDDKEDASSRDVGTQHELWNLPRRWYMYAHRRKTESTLPNITGSIQYPRLKTSGRWWSVVSKQQGVKIEVCLQTMTTRSLNDVPSKWMFAAFGTNKTLVWTWARSQSESSATGTGSLENWNAPRSPVRGNKSSAFYMPL